MISQETKVEFPKTLYALSPSGYVTRYDETNDKFLVSEERELRDEDDVIRVDTIFIKRHINEANYVVGRSGTKLLALMHRAEIVKDSIYRFGPILEGENAEDVLQKYQRGEVPLYAPLFSKMLFTREKVNELKNAPGLDQITRDDLIASLQWRQHIGDAIKSFVEENPDERPHRLYRMVENYRNQKLFLMGYNPYKEVVYNWEKQFAGDDEIITLLTEPISFD
ncbi:hypothetical protein GTQ34_03025 [Muricauda sp. JGD-17]|uniref:Uncharacterized protein n=1 Tax=Flagellimonas ochracea TaxID=2696472 RepID=A0A964WWC5_9FLAO|nr:hypothetical protein [Allomuricauda ochracea]NAY90881.1 hypothetical protein [Allomuricauda ochracea]